MITSGFSFVGTSTQLVRNFGRNQDSIATSIEQLSTGKRINRPSDDPAGFVAAEQIRGELIQLRSENKAAIHRRVNFLQQHANHSQLLPSHAREQSQLDNASTQTSDFDVKGLISNPNLELAIESRTEEVFSYLREDKEIILVETLSIIEDTDFAVATAELASSQVMASAAMAALAYANQEMTSQIGQLFETIDLTAE